MYTNLALFFPLPVLRKIQVCLFQIAILWYILYNNDVRNYAFFFFQYNDQKMSLFHFFLHSVHVYTYNICACALFVCDEDMFICILCVYVYVHVCIYLSLEDYITNKS